MTITSEQFITHMKLRELRRQRETLLATYNQLDRFLAGIPSPATRLQQLYNGLRQIYFAGQPLHPDVTNLEPLLLQAFSREGQSGPEASSQEFSGGNSPGSAALSPTTGQDALDFWRGQLEKELANGRLRSEIVFIFAALLEEWTKGVRAEVSEESTQKRAEMLAQVVAPSPKATPDLELLDRLFARAGFGNPEAVERMQKIILRQLPSSIEHEELYEALRKISHDRYHSATTRRQARTLLRDKLMLKEFADALTLILNDLKDWDWPPEGVTVRASFTPNKWRLFLNEDLPPAALLEILGRRWQKIFEDFFNQSFSHRMLELRKSTTTLPPARRLKEALRLYRDAFGTKPQVYGEVDIWSEEAEIKESDLWEDPASVEPKVKQKIGLEELLSLWASPHSVAGHRAWLKASYRDLSRLDGYASGRLQVEGFTEIEQALAQINAEIRLGHSAFPGKPIYILKADFKDYYPSLSHQLILEVLSRFGLNSTQLEFFRRYLSVRIKEEASGSNESNPQTGPVRMQQGTPNHRRFSDLLGELVMLLLDYYLKQAARVQSIRLIDDLCLIASSPEEALKAWQALEEFCKAFGLSLNEEKSGAICVGGELPKGLPSQPPVWSMVTLNAKGEWRVDGSRYNRFLLQARKQVQDAETVITKVEEYNNSLNYLVKSLALRVRLDDSHRESVTEAMTRFQNDFFGPGRGMVEELRLLITERFLGKDSRTELPDGWLYWPITAGGLSLYHPLVLTNSFARKYYRLQVNPVLVEPENTLPRDIRWLMNAIPKRGDLADLLTNSPLTSSTSTLTVPEERPLDWQRRHNGWYSLYKQLLEVVNPAPPVSNRVMETLVEDFIQRGSEISMGGQDSLSAYWRWMVYLYGPQIRDQLGTFRFLITELVPAQLITGRYRQGFFEHSGAGDEFDGSDLPF